MYLPRCTISLIPPPCLKISAKLRIIPEPSKKKHEKFASTARKHVILTLFQCQKQLLHPNGTSFSTRKEEKTIFPPTPADNIQNTLFTLSHSKIQ